MIIRNPWETHAMTIKYYDNSSSHDVIYSGQNMALDFDATEGTVTIRRGGTYRVVVQSSTLYKESIVACSMLESCNALEIPLVENSLVIVTELSGSYVE